MGESDLEFDGLLGSDDLCGVKRGATACVGGRSCCSVTVVFIGLFRIASRIGLLVTAGPRSEAGGGGVEDVVEEIGESDGVSIFGFCVSGYSVRGDADSCCWSRDVRRLVGDGRNLSLDLMNIPNLRAGSTVVVSPGKLDWDPRLEFCVPSMKLCGLSGWLPSASRS